MKNLINTNSYTTKWTISTIKITHSHTERQRPQLPKYYFVSICPIFGLGNHQTLSSGFSFSPSPSLPSFILPSLMLPSFSHWGTSVGSSWMWLAGQQLLRQQWLYFEECRISEKSGDQETKSKRAGPWLHSSYL